jgi:WD40 repeat protein
MGAAAADAAGHVLVTASDDKTARIWSLPDLRPLGVLRPPIGPGWDGQLYAAAVSPDGQFAAVGGWIGPSNDTPVLLFDLRAKQIVRRFTGFPNTVQALAFSPDGARLAVGLYGAKGIRVVDARDGHPIFADENYGAMTLGLAFATDGRLATSSFDGTIRVYDRAGLLLARAVTSAGARPSRIAFAPDGATVAVGFWDKPVIELDDSHTLAPLGRSATAALPASRLTHLAWSRDGATLFAGGDPWIGGAMPQLALPDQGRGAWRIANPGFDSAASDLIGLPDGLLLASSLAGDISVIDSAGRVLAEKHPRAAGFVTAQSPGDVTRRFLVSPDGRRVAWSPRGAAGSWDSVDAHGVDVTTGLTPPAGLDDWSASADGISVASWSNRVDPSVNLHPLALRRGERAQSVAARGGRVLLGADTTLRMFDANGTQVWEQPAPGAAWRVNLSADGRLAVAAFDDGTVRWFRARDGQELLALFLTRDARRWVAFTPSGYYAAGPGGEELIGWHVNRGSAEAADFFPVAQFRQRFYRPDIVTRVLDTLDEAAAVQQAGTAPDATSTVPSPPAALVADLPPVVSILSPTDGATAPGQSVTVAYAVRSPSGKAVTALHVLVDGRPANTTRGLQRDPPPDLVGGEARGTVAVDIPAGRTVTVALLADTDTHTSEPARIRLTGAATRGIALARPLPRLNAVMIGVSAYDPAQLRLRFPAKDARDLGALFSRQAKAGLYGEVNVHVLTDAQATRAAVLKELDWLRRTTASDDVAVLFLAGQGVLDAGHTFFLPIDGNLGNLAATAISQPDLQDILGQVPGRVVAFVDICHEGVLSVASRTRDLPDMTEFVNELHDARNGLIVFAGAIGRQPALELPELGNGAFAAALLQGLGGGAAPAGSPVVRTDGLTSFVADRVRALTHERQMPVIQHAADVPDFPLVSVTHD